MTNSLDFFIVLKVGSVWALGNLQEKLLALPFSGVCQHNCIFTTMSIKSSSYVVKLSIKNVHKMNKRFMYYTL